MNINDVRELTPNETADLLRRMRCGCGEVPQKAAQNAVLEHAAVLITEQAMMLQDKSRQIRELVREKIDLHQEEKMRKDKPVDPEAIHALGFLEGMIFAIEDDVLYERMKDALEKISRVLK